jgi:hypothetical protein
VLPKNIELTFEVLGVKCATLTYVPIPIMCPQNNERLKNSGFFAAGCWAEDSSIGGNFSPTQYS